MSNPRLEAAIAALEPGTIGLSTIDGRVGGFVKLGQRFMGASKEDSRWSHAFIVGADGYVFEAMPEGLQKNPIESYLADLESGDEVMFIHVPLNQLQRELIVLIGDELVNRKVGYSFSSYLYLFLRRIGVRTNWIRERIGRIGNMICSQTADYMENAVGFQVFRDGRAWQDVIPSDFCALIREDDRFNEIFVLEKP